MLIYSFLKI